MDAPIDQGQGARKFLRWTVVAVLIANILLFLRFGIERSKTNTEQATNSILSRSELSSQIPISKSVK